MRFNSVKRNIARLLDLLLAADIALLIEPVVEQAIIARGARRIRRITSLGLSKAPGILFRSGFATISDYYNCLTNGAYSAVLLDGAILQISYDFEGDELIAHRLVYYPCPFEVDTELLLSEPIVDIIELYQSGSGTHVRLRSPLRFDYERDAQQPGHPAVHLTLLYEHCRWAIVAPLSPGHFVRFIFRHFYPHLWEVHDFLRNWPQELGHRTITEEEERILHVSCSREAS